MAALTQQEIEDLLNDPALIPTNQTPVPPAVETDEIRPADLDALIRDTPAYRPPQSLALSGVRAYSQGFTGGYSDEAAGAIDASAPWAAKLFSPSLAKVPEGAPWSERYRAARDYYRDQNAHALESHRDLYRVAQVGGALSGAGKVLKLAGGARIGLGLAPKATTLARTIKGATALGAGEGLGYSEAETPLGLARDTAIGGGAGAFGAGVLTPLAQAGTRRLAQGVAQTLTKTVTPKIQVADELAEGTIGTVKAAAKKVQRTSREILNKHAPEIVFALRKAAQATNDPALREALELAANRAKTTVVGRTLKKAAGVAATPFGRVVEPLAGLYLGEKAAEAADLPPWAQHVAGLAGFGLGHKGYGTRFVLGETGPSAPLEDTIARAVRRVAYNTSKPMGRALSLGVPAALTDEYATKAKDVQEQEIQALLDALRAERNGQ